MAKNLNGHQENRDRIRPTALRDSSPFRARGAPCGAEGCDQAHSLRGSCRHRESRCRSDGRFTKSYSEGFAARIQAKSSSPRSTGISPSSRPRSARRIMRCRASAMHTVHLASGSSKSSSGGSQTAAAMIVAKLPQQRCAHSNGSPTMSSTSFDRASITLSPGGNPRPVCLASRRLSYSRSTGDLCFAFAELLREKLEGARN